MEPPQSSHRAFFSAAWTVVPSALALFGLHAYLNFNVGYVHSLRAATLGWVGLSALIMASWLLVVPARFRALAAAGLLGLNLALVVVDLCYFRVFRDIPSVRSLAFSGQGFDVWESVVEVLRLRDGLLLALVLAAVGATWWLGRRVAAEARWPRRLGAAALVTGVGAACLAGTLHVANAYGADRIGINKLWNRVEASVKVGVLACHLAELVTVTAVESARGIEPSERIALAAWLHDRRSHAGAAARPTVPAGTNVLRIQVEALQGFTSGLKVAGIPVTPNLNALVRDARYYPNAYAQIGGGGTSDAEFMAATSLYPVRQGAAFVRYGHQRFPTALPAMLQARGYQTFAMHAFPNPGFWNRSVAYPSLGYGTYLDARAMGLQPKVGLGLSDAAFFERGLDRLEATKAPFCASMVTLSSHHPYRRAAAFGPKAFEAVPDETLSNYLRAIHYVDAELGKVFARMKANGMWDKTIVVVYGDHPGIYTWTPALEGLLGGPSRSAWDARRLWRVPLYIHVPGDPAPGKQEIVAGQIDIMPTVAGFLGLEAPVAFGQDLSTARDGLVIFSDGASIAGNRYHDTRTGGTWDTETAQLTAPMAEADLERVRRHMAGSELVLRGDLLPELVKRAP